MTRVFCVVACMFFLAGCGGVQPADRAEVPGVAVSTTPLMEGGTIIPVVALASATAVVTVTSTATLAPLPTATSTSTPTPTAMPTPTELSTPSATPTPAALQYVFPVNAARYDISSSHHDYPAADIACPIGSKFVAVTSGVVDFVSYEDHWPRTGKSADKGGLSVAIIGDDGVRYYGSHLSRIADGIKPGVRVAAGQLLGLTGESGNAKGVYPQLHFGISHPTTPEDWSVRRGEIWPQRYLKAWARGEALAPMR